MRHKHITPPGCRFTAVWEFHPRSDKRHAFEKAYGPNGDWARFFRRGRGYIGTELIRDPNVAGRYVTLDFWTSRLAYQKFRRQNLAAYKALDKRCEALTQSEKFVGNFQKNVPAHLLPVNTDSHLHKEKTIAIRQATIYDVPSMLALSREAPSAASWSESAYRDIFNPAAQLRIALVSDHEGLLKAFLIARINCEDCELENVIVTKKARCKGIGNELIRALAQSVRSVGATRIFLEVRDSNAAARALYEKCGFEITGRRESYYRGPAEDAVLYTLKL